MAMIADLRWMMPEAFPGTVVRESKSKSFIIFLGFKLPSKLDVSVGFGGSSMYWSGRDSWEARQYDYHDFDTDYGDPELLLRCAYTAELSILAPHGMFLENYDRGWRSAEDIIEVVQRVEEHPELCEWFDRRMFNINSRKRIEREEMDDELWGYTLTDWRRIR